MILDAKEVVLGNKKIKQSCIFKLKYTETYCHLYLIDEVIILHWPEKGLLCFLAAKRAVGLLANLPEAEFFFGCAYFGYFCWPNLRPTLKRSKKP